MYIQTKFSLLALKRSVDAVLHTTICCMFYHLGLYGPISIYPSESMLLLIGSFKLTVQVYLYPQIMTESSSIPFSIIWLLFTCLPGILCSQCVLKMLIIFLSWKVRSIILIILNINGWILMSEISKLRSRWQVLNSEDQQPQIPFNILLHLME